MDESTFAMRRIVTVTVVGLGIALAVAAAASIWLGIPRHAAGMAAHGVCSAVFVAGRAAERVWDEDVRPASAALALVTVDVDAVRREARGRFAGLFERRARHLGVRGCVLDASDRDATTPAAMAPAVVDRASPWPAGNTALPPAQWGEGVDGSRLRAVVDAAFEGAGDPRAANARAVAVVHRGRLLVNRQAPGLAPETPLHGWSMAKTVTAMLAHKLAVERGFDGRARVVDVVGKAVGAMAPAVAARTADTEGAARATATGEQPAWAAAWRSDARANIVIDDLLWMRDGLANEESYAPWGAVPRMLFGSPDVAAHAAAAPGDAPPAQRWRYASATTNILARAMRARFADDTVYWAWPHEVLFGPIGANSAALETDAAGTWIASSYLWASSGDWARLGQLLLDDGRWQGREVLPPGFLAKAAMPATAYGEGRGYGAQVWRIGEPDAGICRGLVPTDTLAMRGHWGQIVAVVPSRRAVVVRLGWTFERERFDGCRFVADVLAALEG